ncbi:MAG: hypothetical protein N4A57_07955 [Anaeromicrobium sp.]|jgi:hypothetical protein|uniref:hypothetical protein n=1 Tax=Anaeromicrobium sp. TaxID=1929132 RepID=UPI0025F6DE54|nr:hypothetical protein [Anaeromicrobium sp.]MCT4594184.1 hypothetical protein [Anaeromicrobium sp.]
MEKYLQIIINFNEQIIENFNIGIPLFLKYYLLFKAEIIFISIIIYIVIRGIHNLNHKFYRGIKYQLVKRYKILIAVYRFHTGLDNIIFFLIYKVLKIRVGYRSIDGKDLAYHIFDDNMFEKIKRVLLDLFNPMKINNLIPFTLTIFIYFNGSLNELLDKYFKFMSNKGNLLITVVSLLPAFVVILIIIIGWKYTSLSGRFQRGANRVNQNLIEKTLDIHRRLIKEILQIIDKGGSNLERCLKCIDLLKENRVKCISPLIENIEENKVIWKKTRYFGENNKNYYIQLNDIEEIDKMVKILKEAREKGIIDELFWIRFQNSNIIRIREYLWKEPDKLADYLKRNLLTPIGLEGLYKKDTDEILYKEIQNSIPDEKIKEYIERKIIKDIQDFERGLNIIIVESIEMLVDMSCYHKAVYKLLHFNSYRFGRTLSYWADRE